jgi:hypothetical protein
MKRAVVVSVVLGLFLGAATAEKAPEKKAVKAQAATPAAAKPSDPKTDARPDVAVAPPNPKASASSEQPPSTAALRPSLPAAAGESTTAFALSSLTSRVSQLIADIGDLRQEVVFLRRVLVSLSFIVLVMLLALVAMVVVLFVRPRVSESAHRPIAPAEHAADPYSRAARSGQVDRSLDAPHHRPVTPTPLAALAPSMAAAPRPVPPSLSPGVPKGGPSANEPWQKQAAIAPQEASKPRALQPPETDLRAAFGTSEAPRAPVVREDARLYSPEVQVPSTIPNPTPQATAHLGGTRPVGGHLAPTTVPVPTSPPDPHEDIRPEQVWALVLPLAANLTETVSGLDSAELTHQLLLQASQLSSAIAQHLKKLGFTHISGRLAPGGKESNRNPEMFAVELFDRTLLFPSPRGKYKQAFDQYFENANSDNWRQCLVPARVQKTGDNLLEVIQRGISGR